MIYLVESYDLPILGAGFFLQKEAFFFEHTKIWWRVMIYLSQNMVESYDLPISKNLQKNRSFCKTWWRVMIFLHFCGREL